MSLVLDQSVGKPIASMIFSKGVCINNIDMNDFCQLVVYLMPNTDLTEDDPRLELWRMLTKLEIVDGYLDGNVRLGIKP